MTRALICGGRTFNDRERAFNWFDKIHERHNITRVIEGGANGGDRIGRLWAISRRIPYDTVNADWKTHGRAAGPIRNRRMRDEYKPDIVIALPGGTGTANMVSLAKEKNIPVYEA